MLVNHQSDEDVLALVEKNIRDGNRPHRGTVLLPGGADAPAETIRLYLKHSWSLNNCTILARAERGFPMPQ